MAHDCVRRDAPFRTRLEQSGQTSISARTGYDVIDPTRTYSVFANEFINAVVYCTALYVHSARNEQAGPSKSRPLDGLAVIMGGAKGAPVTTGIFLLPDC